MALTPAERVAWLVARERDRPDMAPHLRRLLAAHEQPEGSDLLHERPAELMAEALTHIPLGSALGAGDMLGPYRLIAPLGQRGMASVWLASALAPVPRMN